MSTPAAAGDAVRRSFNPLFWTLAQIGSRLHPRLPAALDRTGPLPERTIEVATRHGPIRTLVITPPEGRDQPAGTMPPVVLQLHGGGFINRYPEQDRFIARHLAASLGAVVLLPDYDTAPKAQYPVAEHETYDIARWIQTTGSANGWDGARLLLSGMSAGSKLSINICQQLHAAGAPRPVAVSLIVPFTDATRTDRTSSFSKAAISPLVQRSVAWSYFPNVDRRHEPICSPRFDPDLAAAMPPTAIHTAALDTLAPEGAELAEVLRAGGVHVQFEQHPDADHDFYSKEPAAVVHRLLDNIANFFHSRLAQHEA